MRRGSSVAAAILLAASPFAGAIAAPAQAATAASMPALQLAQSGVPASVVADVQSLLNTLGYNSGPVDGLMGSRTRGAIREYQRDTGLPVTAQPSYELRADLRGSVQTAKSGKAEQAAADQSQDSAARLVSEVQSELRRLGYEVPVVNGRMDASTREAIRAYERDNNLLVTGEASTELQAHIRNKADGTPRDFSSRETVRDVQSMLNQRGYNAGPTDGIMGPATRSAIRTFRSDANMELSGRVDAPLLQELGLEAKTTAAAPPADEEPVYETAVIDTFDDGDFTRDPYWRIMAGTVNVTSDGWLESRVDIPQTSQNFGDYGKQILDAALGDSLGINFPSAPNVAAIATSAKVSNGFRARFDVRGDAGEKGTFALGTYQGDSGQGYRVTAVPGGVQLMSVTQSGVRTIAESRSVDLGDGQRHTVELHRDADGSMWVVADGRTVISASDRTFSDPFNGIALINAGGHWMVDRVEVQNRPTIN